MRKRRRPCFVGESGPGFSPVQSAFRAQGLSHSIRDMHCCTCVLFFNAIENWKEGRKEATPLFLVRYRRPAPAPSPRGPPLPSPPDPGFPAPLLSTYPPAHPCLPWHPMLKTLLLWEHWEARGGSHPALWEGSEPGLALSSDLRGLPLGWEGELRAGQGWEATPHRGDLLLASPAAHPPHPHQRSPSRPPYL